MKINNYRKNNYCKCGKKITDKAKRCKKCYGIWFAKTHKGKNNTNWKNGISKIPYFLQKKCFNYKNLRPLWQKENLKKGRNE